MQPRTTENKTKPKNKLFTWKSAIVIAAGLLVGFVFSIYRDYATKGHLDKNDLIRMIPPSIIAIVMIIAFGYGINRPEKRN